MSFVGREAELDLLMREAVLALETASGRSLFVSGPPGAGKSALVSEFLERLAADKPDLAIARGRCLQSFGAADPYLPFVDALRDLADESTSGFVARETVSELLTELAPYWLQVVPLVGGILSAGFATAARLRQGRDVAPSREALFVQYLEILRRLASRGPLVLFLDDLHWSDQSSIALLHHLARGVASLPVVILGTLRSDEATLARHPVVDLIRELEREDVGRRLELGELGAETLGALLAVELGGDASQPLARWIARTAGGNPLFVSELARLLLQSGAVEERKGEWFLTDAVDDLEIPRSAEAVIEKRIERLEPEQIRLLQYASVEGNDFNSTVLADLLEEDELDVLDALEKIERKHQLVKTTGEMELPDGEVATVLRFSHALVQTVLYRQVLGKRRILLHRKCAEVLERIFSEDPGAAAGKLARHFHRGRVGESAFRYAGIAADGARKVYAHWEAEELYRIALEHSPGVEETIAIEERLGDIYDTVGYYERAIGHFQEALGRLTDDRRTSLRLRRKIVAVERKAALVPAPDLLRRVRALVLEAADDPEEHCLLLVEASYLPDAAGVVEVMRGALAVAETLGSPSVLLQVLERLSGSLVMSGEHPDEALPLLQRALRIVEEMGAPLRGAQLQNIVGIAHARQGRFQDALREFESVVEQMERTGDPNKISVACVNLGSLLLRLGEYARAERIVQRAHAIIERRDRSGATDSLVNLAERARLTGELPLAIERYRMLIDRAVEFEHWYSEAVGHAGLGLCLLTLERTEEARDCAIRAVAAIADREHWFEDRDIVEIFLARLIAVGGERKQAAAQLARAAQSLEGVDLYLWARVQLERAYLIREEDRASARALLDRVVESTRDVQSPPLHVQIAALHGFLSPPVPQIEMV